jgi:hypothetical protein
VATTQINGARDPLKFGTEIWCCAESDFDVAIVVRTESA